MFRSRTAQTTLLVVGSALALIPATVAGGAHAEGHLDASYTISFARIPVGEITATAVFGRNEYAISVWAYKYKRRQVDCSSAIQSGRY
jgi:hypothetical protein